MEKVTGQKDSVSLQSVRDAGLSLTGDDSIPLIIEGLTAHKLLACVAEGIFSVRNDGEPVSEEDVLKCVPVEAWDIAYCVRAQEIVDEYCAGNPEQYIIAELRLLQAIVRKCIRTDMETAATAAGTILALITVIT